jgi:SMC interacting uncharacterized protein involved in chromosome segregation
MIVDIKTQKYILTINDLENISDNVNEVGLDMSETIEKLNMLEKRLNLGIDGNGKQENFKAENEKQALKQRINEIKTKIWGVEKNLRSICKTCSLSFNPQLDD